MTFAERISMRSDYIPRAQKRADVTWEGEGALRQTVGVVADTIRRFSGHVSVRDPTTSRSCLNGGNFSCHCSGVESHAADAAVPKPETKRRLESRADHPWWPRGGLVRGQHGPCAASHLKGAESIRVLKDRETDLSTSRP